MNQESIDVLTGLLKQTSFMLDLILAELDNNQLPKVKGVVVRRKPRADKGKKRGPRTKWTAKKTAKRIVAKRGK